MAVDPGTLFQEKAAGARPPRHVLARSTRLASPSAIRRASAETLGTLVRRGLGVVRAREVSGDTGDLAPVRGSVLEAATALVRRRYASCDVCFRECRVDRQRGPAGFCRLGPEGRVVREYLHLGEEEEIIPAHAVYLSGCDLRCIFCSERPHVIDPARGEAAPAAALARRIDLRRAEGARTLDLVGGTPDVNLLYVLEVLAGVNGGPPVVWNSDMGASPWAMDAIALAADAYVADLKFGNDRCAARLSGSLRYGEVVRANILRAAREGYLIVRHLVMPGHETCCTIPALEWLASALPGARTNVMDQYCPTPSTAARGPLARMATPAEVDRARAVARRLGLVVEPPRASTITPRRGSPA